MIGSEIGLNPLQIGTCLSVASAIEAPLFIPAGWAYDRFGRKPVVVPGTATVAAAWAVLATVSTQRGMWIAAAVRCTLLPFVFGAYRLLVLRQLLLAQRSVAMLIRNVIFHDCCEASYRLRLFSWLSTSLHCAHCFAAAWCRKWVAVRRRHPDMSRLCSY